MYESDFALDTEFPVLIDTNAELGRVNHLTYRLRVSYSKSDRFPRRNSDEFVSGGFRFTDLNSSLIYKLCSADRFSTLLIDGERVFTEDNGLNDLKLRIQVPENKYIRDSIPRPIDELDVLSAPISILGINLIDTTLLTLQIGKQYYFNAKNVLFLGQRGNDVFRFSLR